jgi:NAD(P)-dependent dehydrogenase (short-subunit alcohol dehydrogenase family)
MEQRFAGRSAIITGGSLGIGRAVAERLATEGANVLITGRDAARLQHVAAELSELGDGEAIAHSADVAEPSSATETVGLAVDRWGRVDVLVNNAGIYDDHPFLDQSTEEWNRVLAVLLTGPYLMAQRAARVMVEQQAGSIINICSIDAHAADGPYPAYGAGKGGLLTLTKYIAVALAASGVRCNSISPGYVDTPMAASLGSAYEAMRRGFSRVPMGRLIGATEVAALCAFLASDEASAITGSDHIIDAGTLADLYVYPTLES